MTTGFGVREKRTNARRKEKVARILYRSGILGIIRRLHPRYLTVLNYHRIGNSGGHDKVSYKPIFSASEKQFMRQMELVSQWFNVVSLNELTAYVKANTKLPPNAAIITFDDGYLDNYQKAFPILEKHQLPGLIFLTTDYIDSGKPFFWDLVAYCFYSSEKKQISLPIIGSQKWDNQSQLESVIQIYIEAIKKLPETEKQENIRLLPDFLGVNLPNIEYQHMMMNWGHIRALSAKGISFGAHTMTHPILSRIPLDKAKQEIVGSKRRIEEEIGKRVTSFAYPNGNADDFNDDIIELVDQNGFDTAFSLVNGPCTYRSVRNRPFEIRRIFISNKDTVSRFAFKVSGLNRFGDLI